MCSILVAIFASCFLVSMAKAEDRLIARRYRRDATVSLSGSELPTSTSSTATAAETTALSFNRIEPMTACQPGTITWLYQGNSSALTLVVTNQDVVQVLPRQDSAYYTTQLLSTDADPTAQMFTWLSVTVPQGYYVVEASVSAFSTQSLPFYVTNGTDTSCLLSSTPSSSSTSPISPASPPSTSTSVSSSGSPVLDTANSSSHHVNKGAVAGGVIGGLAVAIAAIAVLIFFRCRQSPSRGVRTRGWGDLSSTDSHTNISGKPRKSGLRATIDADPFRSNTVSRHQSQTDSIGRRNANAERNASTIGVSDEDAASLSPSEEKIVTPTGGEMFSGIRDSVGTLEGISPLPYARENRRSSASFKYADPANHSRPRRTNSYGHSVAESWIANGLNSVDDHGSGEGEMIPMSRSASGNGGLRRTPRKPVPVYDPSELPPPTSYNEYRNSNNVDESSSDHHSHKFSSKISLSSLQSAAIQTDLSHKGSLGEMNLNKPVHYLIPDMPPPIQN